MSYQVLARKWRPKSFDQLVGQEHVVQALVNGLDQDRVHHAFLFTGTRGVGKTTLARIFAKCLNCERGMSSTPCGECAACVDIDEGRFVDIIEIDAASRTKVEDTRELLESVQYTPTRGRYKVYIIDEVHMLSNSSFNALLKTLEEPPPHVKFVLATTDPDKIPVTILSRCLQFSLRRMTPDQVLVNLQQIVQSEGIQAEPEALARLARAADGSMRDGLSLLDQAIAFGAGKLTLADVQQMLGLVDHGFIADIIKALAENNARQMLQIVEELVARSRDLDTVLVSLAETLHRICLLLCVPDYSDAERSDWDAISDLAGVLSLEDAQLFYQMAIKGRSELGIAPDPRTGLEMTLLRMLAFRPAPEQAEPGSQASPQSSGGKRLSGAAAAAAHAAELAGGGSARNAQGESLATGKHPAKALFEPAAETTAQPAGVGRAEAKSGSVASIVPPSAVAESATPAAEFLRANPPQPSRQPDSQQPNLQGLDEAGWLDLAETLPIKGAVRELARNLQLVRATPSRWDFEIDHELRHLATGEYLQRLRQAISELAGTEVELRVTDSTDGVQRTVAAIEQTRRRTQLTEAERSIGEDPTVLALKRNFGAQVIEDSIQPVQ